MTTATEQLLVRIDATTEQLRRELRRAEQEVGRAGGTITRSAQGTTRSVQSLDRAAAAAGGQMQQFSRRLGPAGSALSAMGPAGMAAAAGIGALTAAMSSGVREAERFERLGLRTEAVVRATGAAAGFTAAEIRDLSAEIARTTLASREGVEAAAQRLLMFGNVAGEQFERTLRVAQDLASLGLGSIESASLQLGRALEEPARGLDGLRRAGVTFTQSQREMLQEMVDSGRILEAQAIILSRIEESIGGTSQAEAGGLSGAVDSLGQAWSELKQGIGESGPLEWTTRVVAGLADEIERLGVGLGFVERGESRRLALITEELEQLDATIERLTSRPSIIPGVEAMRNVEAHLERRRQLHAEIFEIEERADAEADERAGRWRAAEREVEERFRRERAAAQARAAEEQAARQAAQAAVAAERERTRLIEQQRREEERRAQQQAEGRAALEEQIAQVERETDLLGMSVEAREMALALARQQEIAERGLVEATGDQVRRLEEAVRARQAQEQVLESQRRLAREAARAAEEAAAEWGRIWDQGARNMQDALADAFENALDGGIRSFQDFGRSVLGIMRQVAAQIAAMMVFRPVMGGIAGAVGLGGGMAPASAGVLGGGGGFGMPPISGVQNLFSLSQIGSGTAGGFGGLNTWGFSNLGTGLPGMSGSLTSASLGSILGAGGLGALGGGLLAGITGGNQMTGSLGGGLGAAAAMALGLGPVGAIAGGLIGGLGGGLLGRSRPSVGPVGVAEILIGPDGQLVLGRASADNSGSTAQAASEAQRVITAFNAISAALGVGDLGFGGAGALVGTMREGAEGADWSQFAGIGAWDADTFFRQLMGRAPLGQQPPALASALAGAQGIEDAVRAVDAFVARRDALTAAIDGMASGVMGLTRSFETAGEQMLAQGRAMMREADELGLGAARAAAGMRRAFDEETRQALLGIENPLALALEQLERDQTARRQLAREIGADLVQLERLFGLERVEVQRRFAEAAVGETRSRLRQFLDDLRLDGRLSPLSAVDQLAESRGLFARALGEQDVDAATREAQRLLTLSRDVFASSGMFQQDFQRVTAQLESLGRSLDLPGFASGTSSAPRGLAIVHGNELVNFRGGEEVTSASDTRSLFREVAGAVERGAMMTSDSLGEVVTLLRGTNARLESLEARFRRMERKSA